MKLNTPWIIQKKRDGQELEATEIQQLIAGITSGEVPEYQATAFLMATFFQGMTPQETMALTQAMFESGDHYDLSSLPGIKVDKHSTGGIGDKVSIILAPLAAACGLTVPMMAGRGLGYSGGTLDKLEAIPGFNVRLSSTRFTEILQTLGCAIIGQSEKIAPADKKLYALRDVTATVECVPLITASILSKKLAEGTNALVLDVKVGNGAFMKTREQARKLAKSIVATAKKLNLPCRAVLSNMDQPLGYSVGNALEILECIEILKNEKNKKFSSVDLKELTLHLCAQMLVLGQKSRSLAEGRKLALAHLNNGSAWKKFQEMVQAQGGDTDFIVHSDKLITAPTQITFKAPKKGYITAIDTEQVGRLLIQVGGGRHKASDQIHPGVGFLFHKKLGSPVSTGQPLVTLHLSETENSENRDRFAALEKSFYALFEISASRKAVPKLILETL